MIKDPNRFIVNVFEPSFPENSFNVRIHDIPFSLNRWYLVLHPSINPSITHPVTEWKRKPRVHGKFFDKNKLPRWAVTKITQVIAKIEKDHPITNQLSLQL